jgi:hypothetical protein
MTSSPTSWATTRSDLKVCHAWTFVRASVRAETHSINSKAPDNRPGLFLFLNPRKPQVRVRIRIMKLSKLSSATCIHNSESVR